MALTVDTRTATEYGVVRTFGQADFQFDTLGQRLVQSERLATNLGNNGNLLDTPAAATLRLKWAFIQFAGFTFGRSASAFATPWEGYPGNNSSFLIGGHDDVTGMNNIQYTAQFGNGVSGTIGLDDPTVYNRTALYNLDWYWRRSALPDNAYGGVEMPDIVGNIRVDQAWGLFQLSGALHQVDASYNTLTAETATQRPLRAISGHPESKYGGAVMAAVQIKNIPTGAGDDIKFDATYAKGDTKKVISTSSTSPNFLMAGGSLGQFGPSWQHRLRCRPPTASMRRSASNGTDGAIHLTTAYGLRGAFNHNWDPYWSSSLFGGMGWVRYDGDRPGRILRGLRRQVAGSGRDLHLQPELLHLELGFVTRWTPVKNLTFSAETIWTHFNTGFTGIRDLLARSAAAG